MQQTLLFFMQGIPETVGVCAFSLALTRVKLRWGVIFSAGLVVTAIMLALRSMPITFGLHTVASILLWTLFIASATKVPPSKSFMAVFTSMGLLALLESSIYEVAVKILNEGVEKLMSNAFLWKLTGLPQAIVMIAMALLISRFRRPLEGMWKI
ncbi:hypothetical protein [Desulfocucumis palustris]|nr:hypothetical protein [Desulfocucumis palustris]